MKFRILILTLLMSVAALAQEGTITGVISDKDMAGAPLPFANIVIKIKWNNFAERVI